MDTKRLDLNLLVTLEALLVEQNVTRAAERLHLSQPAVSAQLSRLRDVFRDQLLVPSQRGMTPTAKALELLNPLRESLDLVRSTVSSHQDFDPASAQLTVSIACTDYLQAFVISSLMTELRKSAPGIRVALRSLSIAQLDQQLSRGEVDIALMTPQAAPHNLRTRHLFEERYLLIGRRDHPHLREGMTIEEFAALEHVVVSLRGGDFSTPVDDVLADLGCSRKVVLSAASFLLVPEVVAQSDFVALVPSRLVQGRDSALFVTDPPFPVEGFSVGMVWHERDHANNSQRWVRDLLFDLVRC
jgi:DNA-binding transcriptional LysR family regulator